MKRFLTCLLMLAVLFCALPSVTFVSAEGTNLLSAGDSTFEGGSTKWSAFGAGTVSVADNPSGSGKVLQFKDVPDGKTWASPALNIKSAVTEALKKPGTVTVSLDVYPVGRALDSIFRMRTAKAGDFSLCSEANYCNLGSAKAPQDTWTTLTVTFDVTEADLKSTASAWNFCFDGVAKVAMGSTFYMDNVAITVKEGATTGSSSSGSTGSGSAGGSVGADANIELNTDTSSLPVSDAVATGNFLSAKDATFETGTAHNWKTLSGGKLAVVENPDGEGRVLAYTDCPVYDGPKTENKTSWATPYLNIKSYVQSGMKEAGTLYIAMDVYTTGADAGVQGLFRTSKSADFSGTVAASEKSGNEIKYCSLGSCSFLIEEWIRIEFEVDITEEDLKVSGGYWNLCFNNLYKAAGNSSEGVILIDNVYVGATPEGEDSPTNVEKAPDKPIPEKTPVTRGEKTLVGTIRWDAYSETTPDGATPASQVARVLSPAKYHSQAPFFANVEADGTISFPKYTVATWEKEAEYAINGGLDYYAYIWYESESEMSEARKAHLRSSMKDSIKMAAALETIRGAKAMDELWAAMKDSCYLKLDGQPVLFLYGVKDWSDADIQKLRQMAANAGIEKALYIVGMNVNEKTVAEIAAKDIEGLTWYGVAAHKTAEPFQELADRCEKLVATFGTYAVSYQYDFIPAFTTGRDTLARIETGVSWVDGDPKAEKDEDKPYNNLYSLQPTMAELEQHITNVYNFVQNNPHVTAPNMILSYGWNEHEEGGWLCPTLLCDENGNPILDANGKTQANTERLDTLKKVMVALRGDTYATPEPDDNSGTSASATPTAVASGQDAKGGFNAWYVIIPAVIVAAAGAAVAVIVIKKKKENPAPEEADKE